MAQRHRWGPALSCRASGEGPAAVRVYPGRFLPENTSSAGRAFMLRRVLATGHRVDKQPSPQVSGPFPSVHPRSREELRKQEVPMVSAGCAWGWGLRERSWGPASPPSPAHVPYPGGGALLQGRGVLCDPRMHVAGPEAQEHVAPTMTALYVPAPQRRPGPGKGLMPEESLPLLQVCVHASRPAGSGQGHAYLQPAALHGRERRRKGQGRGRSGGGAGQRSPLPLSSWRTEGWRKQKGSFSGFAEEKGDDPAGRASRGAGDGRHGRQTGMCRRHLEMTRMAFTSTNSCGVTLRYSAKRFIF